MDKGVYTLMKVISYFTPNYSVIVPNYVESMDKYNVSYRIEEYPSRDTWEENCAIKPEFIELMLNEEEDDLFYCDVDAEFVRIPNWEEFKGKNQMGFCVAQLHPPKWELMSAAMYLPNNDSTKEIIGKWKEHQLDNPTVWDQITLAEALNKYCQRCWFQMNLKYCAIDFLNIVNPVILQKQASRNREETRA